MKKPRVPLPPREPPPPPPVLMLSCPYCGTEAPLEDWSEAKVSCPAKGCGDDTARACPGCGNAIGHAFLELQEAWRERE